MTTIPGACRGHRRRHRGGMLGPDVVRGASLGDRGIRHGSVDHDGIGDAVRGRKRSPQRSSSVELARSTFTCRRPTTRAGPPRCSSSCTGTRRPARRSTPTSTWRLPPNDKDSSMPPQTERRQPGQPVLERDRCVLQLRPLDRRRRRLPVQRDRRDPGQGRDRSQADHGGGALQWRFMSYRMACQRADLIAAIVSLAGETFADPADCKPSGPVSVAQVQGTADEVIHFDGGGPLTDVTKGYPGAEATAAAWATNDGCGVKASALDAKLDVDADLADGTDPAETSIQEWSGCEGGTTVQLWTIPNASHCQRSRLPSRTRSSASWTTIPSRDRASGSQHVRQIGVHVVGSGQRDTPSPRDVAACGFSPPNSWPGSAGP